MLTKVALKDWWAFGLFRIGSFYVKTTVSTIWATFLHTGNLLIATSGHTGSTRVGIAKNGWWFEKIKEYGEWLIFKEFFEHILETIIKGKIVK